MMQLSNNKRGTNESLVSSFTVTNNTIHEICSKLIPIKNESALNELSEKLDENSGEAFVSIINLIYVLILLEFSV